MFGRFSKSKKEASINPDSEYGFRYVDVFYEVNVDRHGRTMDINQLVGYSNSDSMDVLSHTYKIPLALVEREMLRSMLPDELRYQVRNYRLKVVPADDAEIVPYDQVTLRMYRDRIEELTKAQIELRNLRSAFGERSEPAQFADKLVSNMEKQVNDIYDRLIGRKKEEGGE